MTVRGQRRPARTPIGTLADGSDFVRLEISACGGGDGGMFIGSLICLAVFLFVVWMFGHYGSRKERFL
jgi:hypothetical protein